MSAYNIEKEGRKSSTFGNKVVEADVAVDDKLR